MFFKAIFVVCIGFLHLFTGASVQADTIKIKFDQLENFAKSNSPGSKIIALKFDRTRAEYDEIMKWSNPEIAYDQENIEDSKEFQIVLSKQFGLPWVNSKKKSGWKDRLSSANLQKEQSNTNHLASLRAGYVKVQLNEQYLLRLQKLREIITDASHVASTRHTEGHISGVDDHLVQMVVISLNASYQDAVQNQRRTIAMWQAAMGFSAEDNLILETEIEYRPINIKSEKYYSSLVESQPGLQSREMLKQSLSKQAAAERAGFIPAINLYGGYKEIHPNNSGYVAGLSLTVPLFNRNQAASKKYEIESNIVGFETQLYRSRIVGHVKLLVSSISDSQGLLAVVSDHFTRDDEALNTLLYSYDEGWLTLNALLNAIQIEVDGLKDYYSQQERYYDNLFELEALVGEPLVLF